jgi:hypothetical protein
VFVERVRRVGVPTADEMLDHARLIARLERAADEAMVASLLRAWYEAVLDEPDLARFHAEWRPAYLIDLAATFGDAKTLSVRSPSARPGRDRVDDGDTLPGDGDP